MSQLRVALEPLAGVVSPPSGDGPAGLEADVMRLLLGCGVADCAFTEVEGVFHSRHLWQQPVLSAADARRLLLGLQLPELLPPQHR